jgi:hypothetical protein
MAGEVGPQKINSVQYGSVIPWHSCRLHPKVYSEVRIALFSERGGLLDRPPRSSDNSTRLNWVGDVG